MDLKQSPGDTYTNVAEVGIFPVSTTHMGKNEIGRFFLICRLCFFMSR